MTEAEQRAAVVAEARTWISTPYHHRARIKGAGVDCAQLPAAVYHAVGLIPDVQPEYPHDWHLHRGDEIYLGWAERFAVEIGRREEGQLSGSMPGPGDFALWRVGRVYSHGGIIVGPSAVVHAYVGVGVLEDDIDSHTELLTRPVRFFSLWAKR